MAGHPPWHAAGLVVQRRVQVPGLGCLVLLASPVAALRLVGRVPGLAPDNLDGTTTAQRACLQQFVEVEADRRSFRSEEHTSELQSLMRISYAVFCLKKKK